MSESEIVYRDAYQCGFWNAMERKVPLIKYKDGKTCVFWDVEDYPIPDGHDLLWMEDEIEKAMKNQGYSGEFSIQAYVDENRFSCYLQRKYWMADIKLCPLSQGNKHAKVVSMLVDVVSWAYANEAESNLIVFSKKLDEKTSFFAEGLFDRGYCVLLSTTQPGWDGPSETEACFLTSLFDQVTPSGSLVNNKRKREDFCFVSDPKFTGEDTLYEPIFTCRVPLPNIESSHGLNTDRLFPKADSESYRGRDTRVLWDIYSFDPIPEDPHEITNHIKSVLKNEGYYGTVSIEAITNVENTLPDELVNEYEQAGVTFPFAWDKDAMYNSMLMTICYWALNVSEEPDNLVVLSENTDFGQGKFPAIRRSMEKNGFNVALTQLKPLMKLEKWVCRGRVIT